VEDGKIKWRSLLLHKLAEILGLSDDFVLDSISIRIILSERIKKEIPYFNYSNPVKHFYDQTTQSVITLDYVIKSTVKRDAEQKN
jgi:hypothetical protein